MRIKALRVAEVGPFHSGVAIEQLSGGLDVLTGPNEAGKSTLFAALSALVGEKHTSVASAVKALRPDAGGAPLIEADLDIEGRVWRLRKRFLAQRSATLRDLGTGEVWRGGEAEDKALSLISHNGRDDLRSFVWVAQGQSFALPAKADAGLAAMLATLIEQEAADTSGAGAARRLRDAVAGRLADLVTASRGTARKGGDLEKARSDTSAVAQRLTRARAYAAAAADRQLRLDALKLELDDLLAPERTAALAQELAGARKALDDAERARELARTAHERVKGLEAADAHARSQLSRLVQHIADLDHASGELAELSRQREQLAAELTAAENDCATATRRREQAAAAIARHRELIARARQAADRRAAGEEAARHGQSIAAAQAAQAAVVALQSQLAVDPVGDDAVAEARRLAAELDRLEARVAAAAPRLSIAYLPAPVGRIRIGTTPLAEGTQKLIDDVTEINIDGIGTIVIAPGGGDHRDTVATRDRVRISLSRALAGLGVADLATAETRLAARRAAEQEMAAMRARLDAAAPHGLPELRQRLAEASRRAEGPPLGELPDLDALSEHGPLLEREAEDCERAVRATATLQRSLQDRAIRLDTNIEGLKRRLSDAEASLPAAHLRAAEEARLAAGVLELQAQLAAAVREHSAWAAATPSANAHSLLQDRFDASQAAGRHQAARRLSIERAIAEIEGALRRDGEEGAGAEVVALEEQLAQAEARLADLELDVRALSLLAAKLDATSVEHRETILRPLIDRLRPLLQQLFDVARIEIEGPLLVTGLQRGGRLEATQHLSDGTREQVATLVRLAYADLMAARGVPMPLVLDDALVFSDDRRLGTMMRILAGAAATHQIIVLSCRETALDAALHGIPACRLQLRPWSETEAVSDGAVPRSSGSTDRVVVNRLS